MNRSWEILRIGNIQRLQIYIVKYAESRNLWIFNLNLIFLCCCTCCSLCLWALVGWHIVSYCSCCCFFSRMMVIYYFKGLLDIVALEKKSEHPPTVLKSSWHAIGPSMLLWSGTTKQQVFIKKEKSSRYHNMQCIGGRLV